MDQMKLPYVYEDRDRHGNVRVYFWRGKGFRKVRIRAVAGSEEFAAEYQKALHGRSEPAAAGIIVGSWRWLCVQYLGSRAFRKLDPRTQRVRRAILEGTYEEPVEPGSSLPFGAVPAGKLTPKAVKVLRDRKEGVEAGNSRVKAVRQVYEWAIENDIGGVTANPAREVKYERSGSHGFHSWEDDEVERFEARHPVGTKARLAFDLLLYTGARRSDIVQFGRQHCRDGELRYRPFKGRNTVDQIVEVPVLSILQTSIDATPTGDLAFLVTTFGKPFTSNGFGNWFRDRCDEAGLPQCSAHGLRKAGARRAAENGATEHQLMAIFGWLTPKEAARYTKAARQRLLAQKAMSLLLRGEK